MRFDNKVVLVTGSISGIGLTTAKKFAEEGACLIVHGPEESKELEQALAQIHQLSPASEKIVCNMEYSSEIRTLFQKIQLNFGRLDILVNNAATQNPAKFLDLSENDWDRVMAVNLKAPFLCSQLAAKLMIQQGAGKIINIGSVHEYQVRRNYAHYSTSKGGLFMLTKNMALELAPYNIQVNQVAPGAIATKLTDTKRQQKFINAIPAGRIGKTSEIASIICFLASEEANYITGQSYTVDGGLTLGFCASRPDL